MTRALDKTVHLLPRGRYQYSQLLHACFSLSSDCVGHLRLVCLSFYSGFLKLKLAIYPSVIIMKVIKSMLCKMNRKYFSPRLFLIAFSCPNSCDNLALTILEFRQRQISYLFSRKQINWLENS